MTRRAAILFAISLTFALLSCLLMLYALLNSAYLLHRYQPPTQIERLEQEIIHDLQQRVEGLEDVFGRLEVYQVTAYTDSCGNGDGFTATGTIPTVGRTIAVDPRKIPLGSRVWIEGLGVFIAEDVGAAVKGNVIDYYIGASVSEAMRFGRQRRRVIVL